MSLALSIKIVAKTLISHKDQRSTASLNICPSQSQQAWEWAVVGSVVEHSRTCKDNTERIGVTCYSSIKLYSLVEVQTSARWKSTVLFMTNRPIVKVQRKDKHSGLVLSSHLTEHRSSQ